MPAVETLLLPLAVILALLGVVYTGVSYRQGRRGRVVQGVALILAPIALYLSGLLRLVWDAVVAILDWVGSTAFSPTIWAGLGLLGLCVVLWLIGAVVTKRSPSPSKKSRKQGSVDTPAAKAVATKTATPATQPAATSAKGTAAKPGGTAAKPGKRGQAAPPVDDEMAEIEALLKSRGIE